MGAAGADGPRAAGLVASGGALESMLVYKVTCLASPVCRTGVSPLGRLQNIINPFRTKKQPIGRYRKLCF